jgi:membrane fusion protein, multidrug efflux system
MTRQLVVEKPVLEQKSQAAAPRQESKQGSRGLPRYWVRGGAILVVLVLAGSLFAAAIPRWQQQRELDAAVQSATSRPPAVAVAIARKAPLSSERTLPGNALPFREAALYARTAGYLKQWTVDIGDRVKEGQILAEISAPDVDDQLAQARANLTLAKANLEVSTANLELAKITLARDVAARAGVSAETVDQDRAQVKTTAAQVDSAKASIEVNQATVQQYADLQAFQKIVAPFPGVITARNVDPGALITADNPSEARELFHIMQTDPLRVFVNVPQVYATTLAPGQEAVVFRPEDPLRQFSGKVTRTANALDPNTRTLLTQVDVPNPKDELRPGMYLQVKFVAERNTPSVLIPSAALVTLKDGTKVALLGDDNTAHYRKVLVGRDYGAEVEIVSGLEGGETVIVRPGDTLPEGQKVEPAPAAK